MLMSYLQRFWTSKKFFDLSSTTRNGTCALSSESMESWPLAHRETPWTSYCGSKGLPFHRLFKLRESLNGWGHNHMQGVETSPLCFFSICRGRLWWSLPLGELWSAWSPHPSGAERELPRWLSSHLGLSLHLNQPSAMAPGKASCINNHLPPDGFICSSNPVRLSISGENSKLLQSWIVLRHSSAVEDPGCSCLGVQALSGYFLAFWICGQPHCPLPLTPFPSELPRLPWQ